MLTISSQQSERYSKHKNDVHIIQQHHLNNYIVLIHRGILHTEEYSI